MLIKEKDPSDQAIQELEAITKIPGLAKDTMAKVEKELKTLKAGNRGESDSAYFIDFHYRSNQNWVVIHDLRIEYGGNVAQIDHVLITRFLEFYVLESKSYAYGLKITDRGEFLFRDGNRYVAMESPIEQTRRHVLVLQQLLKEESLLPKRLGISLPPTIKPFVLVSPKSTVVRPSHKTFNTDTVIKSDELFRQIKAGFDAESTASLLGSFTKVISVETLMELARQLVAYHKPASIDYYAKFGIKPITQVQPQTIEPEATTANERLRPYSKYFCFKCNKPISQRVAMFCFQHKERFGGKAYCFDCQKTIGHAGKGEASAP